jgi:hypothetical protein
MCADCKRLEEVLLRAFGHLQSSNDPQARRAAAQVREALKQDSSKAVAQK